MFRRPLLILLLLPGLLWAQARREAMVVLEEAPLVEQLLAEQPERPLGRQRFDSDDARQRLAGLRLRRSRAAGAIRAAGAEITGETEMVLNAVMVRATAEQLQAVRRIPGVQSAEFAREYEMALDTAVPLVQALEAWNLPAIGGEENAGNGVKIAIVDSGIDHTHPMFSDAQFRAPDGFPRGHDLRYTNNKVIAAWNFSDESTPADRAGHGTFVAGIAGGRRAAAPQATIVGMAPRAWLGNYKVFSASGRALSTAIISAIEAAVSDGMDIINLSLGERNPPSPELDPNARPILNAFRAGVLVLAAASNDGPAVRTISSPGTLPTVLTVGYSSNARCFCASVKLTAQAPVPQSLSGIPAFPGNEPKQDAPFGPSPLVDISSLDPSGLACPASADFPAGVTLPPGSLTGKAAYIKRGVCLFKDKVQNAANAGAVAALVYNNVPDIQPLQMSTVGNAIPSMAIGYEHGLELSALLARTGSVEVSFDPELSARPIQPDIIVRASGRGPGADLAVKPDMVAPGEVMLSATQNINPSADIYSTTRYSLQRGSSFATPMVVGAAALVKQAHRDWRPENIKSALVNTAAPVRSTEDGVTVSATNSGAGRLDTLAALSTTIAAEPVSLSFAAPTPPSPRSSFRATLPLKLLNLGGAPDTLALRVAPLQPQPNVTVELSRTSLTLAPNESAQVLVTMFNTGIVQSVVEGAISVRSQSSGRTINVPYWVTFIVPEVNGGGVVNAASFQGDNGVAPGSIISLFGLALSSSTSLASSLPLPTELGGAKVDFNGLDLALFFTSSGQLNAQAPFNLTPGTVATGRLRVDGIRSQPFGVQIASFSPGLFSRSQNGRGAGAILRADGSVVTAQNPARAGEVISLFGTGLGAVDNPPDVGRAARSSPLSVTTTTPTVTIGGREAAVQFSGLAPGFVGLYQVNVAIPTGLPAGELPVVLSIGGVASNTVTVFVR